MPADTLEPIRMLRPRRRITGISAILLPFDGGAIDWPGFAAHVARTAEAGLTALPGSTFVVRGAEPGKDAKILAAAARYDFANGLSLAAGAEGRWSDGRDLVSATLTARYAW